MNISQKNKTSEGYVAPETPLPFEIELASALRENGKYVECNSGVICSPIASKKFKYQCAEFLGELFEMGIPVTYGSDAHNIYNPPIEMTEKYLIAAGFRDGDIVGI